MNKQEAISIIKDAINNMGNFLENERMALIGFYGGFEGTFRDVLATELQILLKDNYLILTEYFYEEKEKRKWADIAIVKNDLSLQRDKNIPILRMEIKHNYVNDVSLICNNFESIPTSETILIQIITEIECCDKLRKYSKRPKSETSLDDYQCSNVLNIFFDSEHQINDQPIKCRIKIFVL
ncbi:MAG: hypothetical protein Q7J16_06895 [Candidatus Cloacimonadales bacterium]|nr:hypothetical protein [Candidatus Cloacimonadales bacterium]